MTITAQDNRYWYELEEGMGGWARVSLGNLSGAIKGPRLVGADTGSGYIGFGGKGERHAPELASDLVSAVRERINGLSSGTATPEASRAIIEKIGQIGYLVRHADKQHATQEVDSASVGATVPGMRVKPEESLGRVGNQFTLTTEQGGSVAESTGEGVAIIR